ncbi:MAG TPA: hypothetical protein ENI36_01470 [Thermoplasmatales archaeon]|nr:hypothetical protein [Thermoplasmatales archaeon]
MAANNLGFIDVSTMGIQNATVYILWAGIGIAFAAGIFLLIRQIWKMSQYKIKAFIYEQIGNKQILIVDSVRHSKVENLEMWHFKDLNLYSKRFKPIYLTLVKTKLLGLFPKIQLGFTAYKYGDKIVPCEVKSNPGIEPIDYDAWNYLVHRLRINMAKYQRNQQLMRLLPFIALGAVVLAYILGSLFWGQHVEKVALTILNSAKDVATQTLEKSGAMQIITG